MDIKIDATFDKLLESKSGTSQSTGNPWTSFSVLLRATDQYGNTSFLKADILGQERYSSLNLEPGKMYSFYGQLSSKMSQRGSWFTSFDIRNAISIQQ